MKVYFPLHCLKAKSGFIFGWKNEQTSTFVAASVIHPREIYDSFCERVFDECALYLVGVWLNDNDEKSVGQVFAVLKTLSRSLTDGLFILRLIRFTDTFHLCHVGNSLITNGSVVIFYKQPTGNAFLTTSPAVPDGIKFWRKSEALLEQTCPTELSNVIELLNNSHKAEESIYRLFETQTETLRKPIREIWRLLSNFGMKVVILFYALFHQRQQEEHPVIIETIKFFSELSAVFLQLCTRVRQMRALVLCFSNSKALEDKLDYTGHSTESRNSPMKTGAKIKSNVFPVVWFGSFLSAVAIDVVLGLFIVLWLFSNGYNTCATDLMMEKTDAVVQWITSLLEWLQGAPAGLKINQKLAEYLSIFFLYHLFLWQIYLSYIEPYLQIIISFIIMSGCFGATFLLSLASDVMSLITLHIYCFYVYAAMLYNFQLQKLLLLAKLFTGRKWNVEKNQEDIVPYRVDRLFLGTLCFTILLFLLPTTAMYYVVFTTLRLIVLFVKGVVSRIISIMNNLPVFPLITAFFRPDLIPGGIKFEYVNSLAPSEAELNTLQDFPLDITAPSPTVLLILHNQPLPITELFTQQLLEKFPDQDEYKQDWLLLIKKLAKGELIYPWVKSRNFEKEAVH